MTAKGRNAALRRDGLEFESQHSDQKKCFQRWEHFYFAYKRVVSCHAEHDPFAILCLRQIRAVEARRFDGLQKCLSAFLTAERADLYPIQGFRGFVGY